MVDRMAQIWQEIDARRHLCHSRQDLDERRLTAMTALILILALVAGFAALGAYARHDRFAGPGNLHVDIDDLGTSREHRLVRP